MKKIDLHQDIVLSFENSKEGFTDSNKVIDIHGSYAGNLHDYEHTDTVLVWSANWPYHLEGDLNNVIERKITYDQNNIGKRQNIMEDLIQQHNIGVVKNKNDLNELHGFNIVHHVEGIDHIQSINDIEDLYTMGVRSIGFVWNFDNSLAANNTNNSKQGLTILGREIVEFMNMRGMIVDTAHMNHQSMMDVVHYSTKPILNSHSNIRTLHDHTRNVEDEFIDALEKNGGVLGLSIYSAFISQDPIVTIDHYLDQIRYVKNRIGEDHIALGTDFHGLVTSKCIQGLQHISQLNNLEEYIVKEFGSSFAQKFFYDNSMRILQSNLQ